MANLLSIILPATFLSLLYLTRALSSGTCNERLLRFSDHHTLCLPPNKQCQILLSGITDPRIKHQILKLHNSYRSRVASGHELRGGGLPTASNMMQMVWDNQLAHMAQKWASNCLYEHDCNECRAVPNFFTGQNMAYLELPCTSIEQCQKFHFNVTEPNWTKVMAMFYDEVEHFQVRLVKNMQPLSGKDIMHFTQLAWADTWRVGCGFTVYKSNPSSIRQFYVCNYGPAGNMFNAEIYKIGPPCSNCPTNACCGSSCGSPFIYANLCKMIDMSASPIQKRDRNNYIFFCDFQTVDCESKVNGVHNWRKVIALQGSYLSTTLQPGQETTIVFDNLIEPKSSPFCVVIKFRKSASLAGQKDKSFLKAVFHPKDHFPTELPLQMNDLLAFSPYSLTLSWAAPTTMSLSFSVPPDASYSHILDVMEVFASEGHCEPVPNS